MNRRNSIKSLALLLVSSLLSACGSEQSDKKSMTILLVSGWQDVNIGDIAHTPGLLHVLDKYLPDARIILWKRSKSDQVEKLLKKNFPKVEILYGDVDAEKKIHEPGLIRAFEAADVMIHGSGPMVVGQSNLEAWVEYSQKPFGLFGVTIQNINESLCELLSKASFIYTRETGSIEVLKFHGLTGNHFSFAPDATFHFHLKDDDRAQDFLEVNGLEDKKFICVIPRLRYTPYHEIRQVDWSEEKIREVEETNIQYKEMDHAKLREAMIRWVNETGNKVLVCPEMTYQVNIVDELLIDPLPEDVKPNVIKRGYWLTDEAASMYAKAHTVLSFECHSPIIALAAGTPAMYLRQPQDTIKGQMYYDLNLSDWVFEIDDTQGIQIADRLMEIYNHYPEAQLKTVDVIDKVSEIYINACQSIAEQLQYNPYKK
ncbi:polysaccharide pyruvyl transferase family protein [Aquiflexum sp.]|uniref:polysaccharide pyruvyl transferase family protein n=1 Tax=Aquiflexum sp. TaxID=1872584 RepID=UPI00359367BC